MRIRTRVAAVFMITWMVAGLGLVARLRLFFARSLSLHAFTRAVQPIVLGAGMIGDHVPVCPVGRIVEAVRTTLDLAGELARDSLRDLPCSAGVLHPANTSVVGRSTRTSCLPSLNSRRTRRVTNNRLVLQRARTTQWFNGSSWHQVEENVVRGLRLRYVLRGNNAWRWEVKLADTLDQHTCWFLNTPAG